MSRLKILIYANQYDTTVGQNTTYMEFFSQFGEVIMVGSENELPFFIEHGDVLALPGGMDVMSTRYDTKPGFQTKVVNAHYEYLDKELLGPWIKTGKPIIGICRGMQTLNVAMGGTLHRHVEGHVQSHKKERWDTPDEMYTVFEKTDYSDYRVHKINSFHHQAVARLAEGFVPLGWSGAVKRCPSLSSKDRFLSYRYYDGKGINKIKSVDSNYISIIEMMRHESLPYLAFQYHPEEFNCPLAVELINEILDQYYENTTEEKETA